MDIETEKRILDLARKLGDVNRKIVKSVAEKGANDPSFKKDYYSLRDELKELLGEVPPLMIRDPEVTRILRRVREGNYFYLDNQENDTFKLIQSLNPEQIDEIGKILEIDQEKITSGIDCDLYERFETEMKENILPEEYYERKNEFSTIIVGKPLPEKINSYFREVRQCYLFGNSYAAVGLCRVLIEIGFRDKFIKLGLNKENKSSNVINLDRDNVSCIIREVCKILRASALKGEADELYRTASKILHGKDTDKELNLVDFIRRTFKIIENLYDLN